MKQVLEITIDTEKPWDFGLSFGAAAAKLAEEHGAAGFVIEGLLEVAARLHAEHYPGDEHEDTAERFESGAFASIEAVLMERNPEWCPAAERIA